MDKEIFDFSSGQEFDLNAEYKKMFDSDDLIKFNPNELELRDAEEVIKKDGLQYVENSTLGQFENTFQNVNTFFSKYRIDSDVVKNMTKSDRDKLFGYGKELFNSLKKSYELMEFNFEMTAKEWAYLEHTMTKKLSYDGNTVFTYWEVFSNWIDPTSRVAKSLPREVPSFTPSIPVRQLVLLSHLFFKHEEKGSTDSFYSFKKLLFEIAKMTKIFNAYGVLVVRVENRYKHWVNALNAMDGLNTERDITDEEHIAEELPLSVGDSQIATEMPDTVTG